MIEAFHSNWTAPFLRANPNKNYYIDDFEILTTIISALKWRENNGSIKMITDDIAADYYKKLGIDTIWDLGIDVSLNKINNDIDSDDGEDDDEDNDYNKIEWVFEEFLPVSLTESINQYQKEKFRATSLNVKCVNDYKEIYKINGLNIFFF